MLLETPRLLLIPTPLDIIWTRLARGDLEESFVADVVLNGEQVAVTFPAAWPGDALALFPKLAAQLEANPQQPRWEGTLLERATLTAVGQMGCKAPPDARGEVEIGYGLNPEAWGRGYASEMVGALCTWLLQQPAVSQVTALTRDDNRASIRVLQKSGFRQIGEEIGDEGLFLLWAKRS